MNQKSPTRKVTQELPVYFDGSNAHAPVLWTHNVLRDLLDRGVVIFLDDILIYSDSAEEHERLLREVFTRMRKHTLFAKESKCELWRTEVTFLGHVINADGVSMEACKVAAVTAWPQPQDPGDIRSFLGLAGLLSSICSRFFSHCHSL